MGVECVRRVGSLWREGVSDEWCRKVDVNEGWAVDSEGGIS